MKQVKSVEQFIKKIGELENVIKKETEIETKENLEIGLGILKQSKHPIHYEPSEDTQTKQKYN